MIKRKNTLGFTLIEMLVSIAIIITTTTVVVAILASSFKGITKSAISEDVRQNGNSALSRMTRTIQFAQSFHGVSKNNTDYITDCSLGGEKYNYVRVRANSQTVTFSCTNADIIMENSSPLSTTSLIDKSRVAIVEDSCKITCLQGDGAVSPVINISFELFKAGVNDQKNSEVFFSTSVKMRNL